MQKIARPRMDRRQFFAYAALASAGLVTVSARADARSNMLIIPTDQ
ncbi:MAG: hypothetical protein JNK74_12090 [Candidatus Hydrogenedentes bacterium]|nr:hypothetical protein [Candidatus Hydrogenedentota bacterium]